MSDTETVTPDESLEEAAARIFGPVDEPETTPDAKPEPEPETRDEKGRFVAKAEPAKEPEKPAEAPKPAEDEKVAARINAAKRAELRAAQERAELQRAREEVAKQKAELEPLLKLAEQVRSAKASPSRLLELSGLAPKDFLESLAHEHDPAQVAERVKAETSTELDALRKEIADLKAAREQELIRAQRQKLDSQVQEAQKAFVDHVAESAAKYPHLVEECTPEEMAAEALAVAQNHGQDYFARFGVYPDDEVIAEHLEERAKEKAASRAAWRQRIGKPAHEPSKGDSSGDTGKRPAVKAEGPRTLTSRAASAKATPPREWSQEEADAEALRILESAFAAKR